MTRSRKRSSGSLNQLKTVIEDHVLLSPTSMNAEDYCGASRVPFRKSTLSAEYNPVTTIEKTDPIWSMYVEEAQSRDKDMLEAWNNNMDVLLVFAGLFSAILTAFLVELHQELKENPVDVTNHLLQAILEKMDYMADNNTKPSTQPYNFTRDKRNTEVNFLWFISLTFSMLAASGAMLAKQWIQEYLRDSTTGSPYDQALLRHKRYNGLEKWWFRTAVDIFPTLLHIALILFFCGLIHFLWGVYAPIAKAMLGLFAFGSALALLVAFFAMLFPGCPYRTALVRNLARSPQVVRKVIKYFRQKPIKLVQAIRQWSKTLQDASKSTTTPKTEKGSCLGGSATDDVISPLIWLLRESREEDTVRASLKLLPAVNSISDHRGQVLKLGAITRLCELFDPSHPFYFRITKLHREAFAFGLALRSLLPTPGPKPLGPLTIQIPKPSLAEDTLQVPLDYMANHENINLRILAASFAPVLIMNVVDAENSVTGKEIGDIVDQVTTGRFEVDLWARVLLLDALQEWMIYIFHHAPPGITRKQENAPVFVLTRINLIAKTTPHYHVTYKLLSAVLCSMTVALGARDMHETHHPSRISNGLLGERLVRCLGEMQRNKKAEGEPRSPRDNCTVLELPDVELSLIEVLSIVNKLLSRHPSMFGKYWEQATSQLIDFACDSDVGELVSMSLQTLLLGEHRQLAREGEAERNNRLIKMCMAGLSNLKSPLPEDSFLKTLKIMEQALCVPGQINQACGVLLMKEPKSMTTLLVEGLRKDNSEIRLTITKILNTTLNNPKSDPAVTGPLMDQLVEAGLLTSLFGLIKQELQPGLDGPKFGPKLTEMLKPIGWLARSPKSISSLEDDSALENLITIVHHKKAYWEKNYAARAIVLLWDSATRYSAKPERLRLTQRIIDSGFLSTLCGWFERGDADDVLYDSCQELRNTWAPLLRVSFELYPSAFSPPPHYLEGPLVQPAAPSPFGLVPAMNRHLRRPSFQNNPHQATAINFLHDFLDQLEADMIIQDENFQISQLFPADDLTL